MNIRKTITAAIAALLLLAGCAVDNDDQADSEAAEATEVADAEGVAGDSEPEPESTLDADEVEQALLDTFGVDNFQELESTHWAYYIQSVETPSESLIRLTMQTDSDDSLIEGASESAFSLIGGQFEDVSHLELVDGAGVHIEQTHRSDVPLLN